MMGWETRKPSGGGSSRIDPTADAHIREDVENRLADDPGIDASDVEVRVEAARVMLIGTVPSELARQMAEVVAFEAEGVMGVENNLTVRARRKRDAPPAPRRHDRQSPIEPGTDSYLKAAVSPQQGSLDSPNDPDNRPGIGTGGSTPADTSGSPARSGVNVGSATTKRGGRS